MTFKNLLKMDLAMTSDQENCGVRISHLMLTQVIISSNKWCKWTTTFLMNVTKLGLTGQKYLFNKLIETNICTLLQDLLTPPSQKLFLLPQHICCNLLLDQKLKTLNLSTTSCKASSHSVLNGNFTLRQGWACYLAWDLQLRLWWWVTL